MPQNAAAENITQQAEDTFRRIGAEIFLPEDGEKSLSNQRSIGIKIIYKNQKLH
jgi:hypothetical protein